MLYKIMLLSTNKWKLVLEGIPELLRTLDYIRESVDSLCSDGADVQDMQYLKQNPYNFTTNTLKAYLGA